MGDAGEITIYRNSIPDDLFYEIFNKFKDKYNFSYELHITDGYYETNCFDILSNKHKKTVIIFLIKHIMILEIFVFATR